MKSELQFIFDPDKNRILKEHRGVNFEDVINAIGNGRLLDIRPHHNPTKYSKQEILVVEINDYTYLVPCEWQENIIILKTVYPSRKAMNFYKKGGEK